MVNSAYSPIEHLADALCRNHEPSQRYFTLLTVTTSHTAYFDVSGHPQGTAILVVGGFIATAQNWKTFETEWNAILKKYGVPVFHMKKFIAKRKPFDDEKWNRERLCTGFLSELIGVVSRANCHGVMAAIPLSLWQTMNEEYYLKESRLTPFALAGCVGVMGAYEWCGEKNVPRSHVEFVFEDGDEDKGDFMHWTKKCWSWVPSFKGKSLVPLQACDFIAWEGRRAITDMNATGGSQDTYKFRASFDRLLERIHQENRIWSEASLRRYFDKIGLRKR
jgi:hypothetical protein